MMDTLSGPDLLIWCQALVEPALHRAVATLPESMSRIAGYHFGWTDPGGRPTPTGGGGGKMLRPALALSAARAAGGDPASAVPAGGAVDPVHHFSLPPDGGVDGG